jgi:hypothetical protein
MPNGPRVYSRLFKYTRRTIILQGTAMGPAPPKAGVTYSFFPPEKWVYISFSPGKISIYSFFPPERSVYTHLSPWILGGKSEYILKFPPHTQFSPYALIDYTRAITPIRGRPYGDFCRAFDAEEGRSPLFFSICNTFWNISQWLQFDPYVLFLAMAAIFFHRRIYNSQTIVYTP